MELFPGGGAQNVAPCNTQKIKFCLNSKQFCSNGVCVEKTKTFLSLPSFPIPAQHTFPLSLSFSPAQPTFARPSKPNLLAHPTLSFISLTGRRALAASAIFNHQRLLSLPQHTAGRHLPSPACAFSPLQTVATTKRLDDHSCRPLLSLPAVPLPRPHYKRCIRAHSPPRLSPLSLMPRLLTPLTAAPA